MRKTVLAILLIFLFLSGCSAAQTAPAAAQPEQTPAPTATPAVAVTPEDYPVLPGLSEAGVIPKQSYHIGIVIGASSPYADNSKEWFALADAYKGQFGMTMQIEQPDDGALLESGIDFLIFAPGGEEPLGEADSLCAAQGVSYMTIGRRIEATPGEGSYVCTIEPDEYLNGMLTGLHIVETMKAQYGEAFGNIGEITGVVSDEASILRSSGLRRALGLYESVNVVCSVAGNNDEDTIYKAAVNIFKAYREGELDGIVVPDDSAALTVLQAALDYDRNDVVGRIWSTGATADGLTGVYYGQLAQTIEITSQTGIAAMEYALAFLEGGADIPPIITSLTRVFTAETQEKKDGIAQIIAALKERGAKSCLESVGDYGLFIPDEQKLRSIYPQRYDTRSNADAYLEAFEPYTTQKAIYKAKLSGNEEGEA
jgi:ABC-type sugar transport system substrate-binding protein